MPLLSSDAVPTRGIHHFERTYIFFKIYKKVIWKPPSLLSLLLLALCYSLFVKALFLVCKARLVGIRGEHLDFFSFPFQQQTKHNLTLTFLSPRFPLLSRRSRSVSLTPPAALRPAPGRSQSSFRLSSTRPPASLYHLQGCIKAGYHAYIHAAPLPLMPDRDRYNQPRIPHPSSFFFIR